MKKILSVVLVLTCMFALFSCNFELPFGNGGNDNANEGVAAFTAAIENTNASNIIVESVVNSELGELESRYEIVYNADGSATITYEYEQFNLIGEGADNELVSTFSGVVTRNADGTYSGDMPAVDLTGVTAGVKLNLAAVEATVNESGDVLTANVAAANTEAGLGSAFSEDVALEMTIANGAVKQISLTFASGSVNYSYD